MSSKYKGVTFGFYARHGYFGSEAARTEVQRMKETGVQWVCVVPTVMQDTYCSTRQYRDFEVTPGDDEIRSIIQSIHDAGMKVMLRPMLETQDGWGRLKVTFPPDGERIPGRSTSYWQQWFASMEMRSVYYAKIAAETGCAMYGLDSELDQTVGQHDHWKRVIASVRKVYDGHVTSCHTHHCNFIRELENKDHWWNDLDSLSTSFYCKGADKQGASVDEIKEKLQEPLKLYRQMVEMYGKTLYFGECGCTSSTGGAIHPAGWQGDGVYAPDEQANYLQAVLDVFNPEPWWKGLFWWKWDEQNVRPHFIDDPAGDKGFTMYGKKAAHVFKSWQV